MLMVNSIVGKDLHNILNNIDLKPIFEGVPAESQLTYKNVRKLWKVMKH